MIQLTSEDDYRTGCRNVNHCQQQKSYSGLFSPGRSNSTYFWNDSWVQTFHRIQNSCQARYLPEFLRKSPCRIRDPAGITRFTIGASKESMNLCPEWIHRFHQLIHHVPKGTHWKLSSYICAASVTKANVHTEQDWKTQLDSTLISLNYPPQTDLSPNVLQRINLIKLPALRFSVDGKHFEKGNFSKRLTSI